MRRYPRFRWLVLLVLISMVAASSGAGRTSIPQAKAEDVALAYYRFIQQGKYSQAYNLLSKRERSTLGLDAYREWVKDQEGAYKSSEYVSRKISSTGQGKRSVNLELRVDKNTIRLPINVVQEADGKWAVSYGDEFASRTRAEAIVEVVTSFGAAWVGRDYDGMLARLSSAYQRKVLGNPPLGIRLKEMCATWEAKHGPLRGIGCTWRYVRCSGLNKAYIPAKLSCDPTGKGIPAFVPYVVELQRDPTSGQWRIASMEITPNYRTSTGVAFPLTPLSPGDRKAMEAAKQLGINGVKGK